MIQDKRLLRLANKARALTELYKHASILVPLAVPQQQQRLPDSLQLDLSSRWHTSALLASVVETITLPSRLKDVANRDSLGTIADMLNAMGRQSIAGVQMSFGPHVSQDGETPSSGQPAVVVPPPAPPRHLNEEDNDDEQQPRIQLDIDFSPSDQLDWYASSSRGNGSLHKKKNKVFSQGLVRRGYPEVRHQNDDTDMTDELDDARERQRRRPRPEETVTKR